MQELTDSRQTERIVAWRSRASENNGTRFKYPAAGEASSCKFHVSGETERIQSCRDLAGLQTLSDLHL